MSKWPKWVSADYGRLYDTLKEAYHRTAVTKGHVRHGEVGVPVESQGTVKRRLLYGPGVTLGQATKKIEESQGLTISMKRNEILDAINYLAFEIIALDMERDRDLPPNPEEPTHEQESLENWFERELDESNNILNKSNPTLNQPCDVTPEEPDTPGEIPSDCSGEDCPACRTNDSTYRACWGSSGS